MLSRVRLQDPMDCSAPGSPIHGIFQARILEWGAITFSDITYSNVNYIYHVVLLAWKAQGKEAWRVAYFLNFKNKSFLGL